MHESQFVHISIENGSCYSVTYPKRRETTEDMDVLKKITQCVLTSMAKRVVDFIRLVLYITIISRKSSINVPEIK